MTLHFLNLALYITRTSDGMYQSGPSDTDAVVIFVVYKTVIAPLASFAPGMKDFRPVS
jgi:hypothetical protein